MGCHYYQSRVSDLDAENEIEVIEKHCTPCLQRLFLCTGSENRPEIPRIFRIETPLSLNNQSRI